MDKNPELVVSVGRDLNDKMQPEYRVYETFESKLGTLKLNVELKKGGSFGVSPGKAIVTVHSNNERWVYPQVSPEQVNAIIEKHLVGGKPIQAWLDTGNGGLNVPLLSLDERKAKSIFSVFRHSNAIKPIKDNNKSSNASQSEENQETNWTALNFIGVGWSIALSVLLGIFGGIWLDNLLHTQYIFLLVGLVLGLAAAAYIVARIIKQSMNLSLKPRSKPDQVKQLQNASEEVVKVRQQTDKHIQEIREHGHESIEQAVIEASEKQNQTRSDLTETADDLMTRAHAKIAQDKNEAIAKLRREYAELAKAAGLTAKPDNQAENSNKDIQHQGHGNG